MVDPVGLEPTSSVSRRGSRGREPRNSTYLWLSAMSASTSVFSRMLSDCCHAVHRERGHSIIRRRGA